MAGLYTRNYEHILSCCTKCFRMLDSACESIIQMPTGEDLCVPCHRIFMRERAFIELFGEEREDSEEDVVNIEICEHVCASCKKPSSCAEIRMCITCANSRGSAEKEPKKMAEFHFCSNCILDFHANKGHHQEKLMDLEQLHRRLGHVQNCSRGIQANLESQKSSMREREQNYKMIFMICELVNREANNLSAKELSMIYHMFTEMHKLSIVDKDIQQRMTMNRKSMMARIPQTIAERIQKEKNNSFKGWNEAENAEYELRIRELEEKCKLLESRSRRNKRNGSRETPKAERLLEDQIAKLNTQKTELEEKIFSIQEKLKNVEARENKAKETIQNLRDKVNSLETEDKNRMRVWTADNIEILLDAIAKTAEQGELDGEAANFSFGTGCVKRFQVCMPSEAYWQRDGVIVSLKETLCLTGIGLYKQSRNVGDLKVRIRVFTNSVVLSNFMATIPYTDDVDNNVHLVAFPRKLLMLSTVRYYFELTYDRPAKLWWGFGGAEKMDVPGFPTNKITFSLQDTAFEGQIPEFHFTDQLVPKQFKRRGYNRRK